MPACVHVSSYPATLTFGFQQDVEDILNSTSPQPVMTVHKHGGKPLSEAIVGPHSPQTRPGYARKTPAEGGGYFTG